MRLAAWRDEYLAEEVDLPDRPEPTPDLPPALGVVFGCQLGWSRERESQSAGTCSACGGKAEGSLIGEGSRLYCAACCRSGFDHRLPALLHKHPAPAPDPKPQAPPEPIPAKGTGGKPGKIEVDRRRISVPERFQHLLD